MNVRPQSLFIFFFTLFSVTLCNTEPQDSPDYYDHCKPFNCGNVTVAFPFSSTDTFGSGRFDCGLPRFQISCDNTTTTSSSAAIDLSGRSFTARAVFYEVNLITLVNHQLIADLRAGSCQSLRNLSVSAASSSDLPSLGLPQSGINLTFFQCRHGIPLSNLFLDGIVGNYSCGEGEGTRAYLWDNGNQRGPPGVRPPVEAPIGCEMVMVPGSGASLSRYGFYNRSSDDRLMEPLIDVLSDGFPMEWPVVDDCAGCEVTGGRCGYDGSEGRIVCFWKGGCVETDGRCRYDESARRRVCSWNGGCVNQHKSSRWKLIVGVATGSTFALLALIALLIITYKKRTFANFRISYISKSQTPVDERNAKEFIKTYQSTLLTKYSYSEIKKMTNSFKEKLGEGGYGSVYKGKLSDGGRLIAVKMLENYKDNGDNFVNEVATIGTIHHINVIRLLGFCWDGSKKALIYEYMPNGSLGDLLSKNSGNISLELKRLLEIASGVAHGIEYLHNGCDSRILHLDIKPQNVLLDQNLSPKISDFGLAKIYSRNKSAVTMTGAKGTIGYIAPEIFLRNIGSPSHKSDVYSFGMLLLEMVGERKHFEVETRSSREVYFPGYIYDKLIEKDIAEHRMDLVVEEEADIAKKMVMVGLWCIQMNPKDRPSMTRVVEMLSSNVDSIEMPPKPFFFSPPRLQFEHDIGSTESSDNSVLPLTSTSQEM